MSSAAIFVWFKIKVIVKSSDYFPLNIDVPYFFTIIITSFLALHNDKPGRIFMRPIAVTIQISYENLTGRGIFKNSFVGICGSNSRTSSEI